MYIVYELGFAYLSISIFYKTIRSIPNFIPIFTETTTTKFNSIPEAPRSIFFGKNSQNSQKVKNNQISSDGLKLRNKIEEILFKHQQKTTSKTDQQENNKKPIVLNIDENSTEDGDDVQPFTVVRVSSSVSQVILYNEM